MDRAESTGRRFRDLRPCFVEEGWKYIAKYNGIINVVVLNYYVGLPADIAEQTEERVFL